MGWTRTQLATGGGNWARTTPGANSTTGTMYHNYATGNHDSWMVSPSISLPSGHKCTLSFYERNLFVPADYEYSGVLISTGSADAGSTDFVEIYESDEGISSFTLKELDLTGYAGNTIYIAFVYKGNFAHSWFVDEVEVTATPLPDYDFSITYPAGVSVLAGESHDYTVTIYNEGEQDDSFSPAIVGDGAWTYALYQADGTTPLTGSVAINSGATYNFIVRVTVPTGVNMGDTDTENFTVTSATGGQVKNFSITTTASIPYIPPYHEGFDDVTFPPAGWTRTQLATGGGNWARTTPGANSTTGTMYHQYANGNHNSWMVSPPISLPSGHEYTLSFYERNQYVPADYEYSGVLISTGSGEAGSIDFVEIYESDANISGFTLKELDISSYAGNTVYIAFVYKGDFAHSWFVDEVNISEPSLADYDFSITYPAGVSVLAGESHDYTVTIYNEGLEDDTYTPVIAGSGKWSYELFDTDGTTPLNDPVAIDAGDTYDFIIRVTVPATGVSMGDTDTENFMVTSTTGGQVKNFSITTTAIVPVALPYLEGFDDETFPPVGWNRTQLGTGTNNWIRTTPGADGTTGTMFHSFSGNNNSWMVSPPIALPSGHKCTLSFFERNQYMTTYGYSGVRISTGSGEAGSSDFVELYESNVAITSFTLKELDLTPYKGETVYIAFVYQGVGDHNWWVDEVEVTATPLPDYDFSIAYPDGVVVLTGDSHDYLVTISNDGRLDDSYTTAIAGDGSWAYELFEADGTTSLSGSVPIAAGDTYDFIVRVTVPETGVSMGDTDTENFTVTSTAGVQVKNFSITTTPKIKGNLSEGFEGATFPPKGWKVINRGGDNTWRREVSYPIFEKASASIERNWGEEHDDWLITPPLAPTAGNNTISFWAKNDYSSNDKFNVMLSYEGNNVNDFRITLASNVTPNSTAQKYSYNLGAYNGQIVYIAIQVISEGGTTIFVDDFEGPRIYAQPYDFALTIPNGVAIEAGKSHDYMVTILNDGAQSDSFTLALEGEGDWNYELFQSNGTTPLTGSVSIDPGDTYNFIVRVTVPATGVSTGDTDTQNLSVTSTTGGHVENFSITTTALLPVTPPFLESFEDDEFPPLGWTSTQLGVGEGNWSISFPGANSTNNSMVHWRGYGFHDSWMVSPPITLPAGFDYFLFFEEQNLLNPGYGYSGVLISTGSGVAGSPDFVEIYESNKQISYNFSLQELDISAYAGNTVYIAFVYRSDSYLHYWYVDEVAIKMYGEYDAIAESVDMYPEVGTGCWVDVEGTVRNEGKYNATFDVSFSITDENNVQVYYDDQSVTLDPHQEQTIMFNQWQPTAAGIYTATLITDLVGDEIPQNDAATFEVTVTDDLIWYWNLDYTYKPITHFYQSVSLGGLNPGLKEVADDFILEPGVWNISAIHAFGTGKFSETDPQFMVVIYADNAGEPGVLVHQEIVPGTCKDDPVLTFAEPLILEGGHYWLTVAGHYPTATSTDFDNHWAWQVWGKPLEYDALQRDQTDPWNDDWNSLSGSEPSTNFAIFGSDNPFTIPHSAPYILDDPENLTTTVYRLAASSITSINDGEMDLVENTHYTLANAGPYASNLTLLVSYLSTKFTGPEFDELGITITLNTGKEVEFIVIPEVLSIVGIATLEPLRVVSGTPFEELNLPQSVEVTLNNGTTTVLDILWDGSSYDSETLGTYEFDGEIVLVNGVPANPGNLVAKIEVNVLYKEDYIFENFNNITGNPLHWDSQFVNLESFGIDGTKALVYNFWGFGSNPSRYWETPIVVAGENPIFSFMYRVINYSNGEATPDWYFSITLSISHDLGVTFTDKYVIGTGTHTPSADFTQFNLDMSEYIGEYVIVRVTGTLEYYNGDFNMIFDDVKIGTFNTINFTITDGTNPIENAIINVADYKAITDASGEASMPFPNGEFPIQITADGFLPYNNTLAVEDADVDFSLEMIPLNGITFNVVDPSSNPISGVAIAYSGTGEGYQEAVEMSGSLITNASGVATVGLPNGNYEYNALKDGYEPVSGDFEVSGDATVTIIMQDTPPTLEVTPTALNFGDVPLYSKSGLSITLKNIGMGDLYINRDDIILTGDAAFTLQNLTADIALSTGQTKQLTIYFTPEELIEYTSELYLIDSEGEEKTIDITGNGWSASLPFVEDFTGTNFLPQHWSQGEGLLQEVMPLPEFSEVWYHESFANLGSIRNSAQVYIGHDDTKDWLMTPPIDLGAQPDNFVLEFDAAYTIFYDSEPPFVSGDDAKFAVVASWDGGQTWSSANVLRMWDNAGSEHVLDDIPYTGARYAIPLEGASGFVKLGFYAESSVENTPVNSIFITNVSLDVKTYTLTLIPNPTDGGIVTGGGDFKEGDGIPLLATPNSGYRFVNWTNESDAVVSVEAAFEYTMPAQDVTLTANFEIIPSTYTLTLVANPTEGGVVSGGGDFEEDDKIPLLATPNSGYRFVNWTNAANEEVSDEAEFEYTMPAQDVTLTANFEHILTYTLTLVANPTEGGVVSGGGDFEEGEEVTLSATANAGFEFVNWINVADEVVSDEAAFEYTMPAQDVTLTANFEIIPPTYTLTLVANPTEGGVVTGGGDFEEGDEIPLLAMPNTGYIFVSWTNAADDVVSEDAGFEFTMPAEDVTLTANFTQVGIYVLSLTANPPVGGTVTGGGAYDEGDEVIVTAIPNDGYEFISWTNADDEVVSLEPQYEFIMPGENVTLTANFGVVVTTYTLTLTAYPAEGGIVSGSGEYQEGDGVTVLATPNTGYDFVNWTNENDEVISTDAEFEFTMSAEDVVLTANFMQTGSYLLTLLANPPEGGVVSGAGAYEEDDVVTVSAIANDGYVFVNWTNAADEEVSAEAEFEYTMPAEDITLTAHFEQIPTYTLTLEANPADGGVVSGGGEYEEGQVVTITAVANAGYEFVNWTDEEGEEVGTDAEFEYAMPAADVTLTANFEAVVIPTYTLTLVANPADGGVVSGGGEYEEGQVVTITAVANAGYEFVNWTDESGVVVSTNFAFDYTMPAEDITLTANFEEVVLEYTITFTVHSQSGLPIEGAEVNIGGIGIIITNASGEVSTQLPSGSYSFVVTAEGYDDHNDTFEVSDADMNISVIMNPTGVDENTLAVLSVYPNPFGNSITLDNAQRVNRLTVNNIIGQKVLELNLSGEERVIIPTEVLKRGIYLMVFEAENGERVVKRMVKE